MYNSIYPININYRNKSPFYKNAAQQESVVSNQEQPKKETPNQSTNTFPNGTKVAIDYTKGQINISQVLTDFRNTIIAINAPDEVRDEVNTYLTLTEKESYKENPSREIIMANLRNASRVSDDYITKTLGKHSNVVAGWIDALFLQKINLKADPDEINPDFLLEFPKKAQERIESNKASVVLAAEAQQEQQAVQEIEAPLVEQPETMEPEETAVPFEAQTDSIQTPQEEKQETSELKIIDTPLKSYPETISVSDSIELSSSNIPQPETADIKQENTNLSPFAPRTEADRKARELFIQAKAATSDGFGDAQSLNLLNEALGILADDENANNNLRAAIHRKRGEIFDTYNYVDYALRDYWEATKATDLNLKANAFYKTGLIYDEFSEFSPALSNYLSSVAYLGEVDNKKAQSQVLSKIAELYSKQYDRENFSQYSQLAIDSAIESENNDLLAQTYSMSAQNYQYLGEHDKALDGYKNALAVFSRSNESLEQKAYNYEQAAIVMSKLGNNAKAAKLQAKANLYYQKAQLQQEQLQEAS